MEDMKPEQNRNKKRQAPQPSVQNVGETALNAEEIKARDAALVKKYFLRWQSKRTVYQQLKRLSADNAQQLMALSQQVTSLNWLCLEDRQNVEAVVLIIPPNSRCTFRFDKPITSEIIFCSTFRFFAIQFLLFWLLVSLKS